MIRSEDFKTFKEMKEDTSQPPEPIVGNGILLESTILTIVGPPKVGKTFLVFDLAISLAVGRKFLESDIKEKKSVLILSAEGGYFPNRDRVKTMTENVDSEELANIRYLPNAQLSLENDEDIQVLLQLIKDNDIGVLIIDPFIRFHQSDENSSSAMSSVYRSLQNIIKETKVAICLVHHTGKNEYLGARGSSVIRSEYDSCILLKKDNTQGGIEVSFDMRHVATPDRQKLVFDVESYRFNSADAIEQEQIRSYVEEPIKKKDLVNRLIDEGPYCKTKAYAVIKEAIIKGELIEGVDKLISLPEHRKN